MKKTILLVALSIATLSVNAQSLLRGSKFKTIGR